MTKDILDKYLAKPSRCPFCGSSDIESGDPSFGFASAEVVSSVECNDCDKTWTDFYTLTHAE